MPISRNAPATRVFCDRYSKTSAELIQRVDALNIDLALVDDLLEAEEADQPPDRKD